MTPPIYLTTEEVAERYRGEISTGTLENWRVQRLGPPFVKIGKAVLYPVEELDAWDRRNLVACDDGKVEGRGRRPRGARGAEPPTIAPEARTFRPRGQRA